MTERKERKKRFDWDVLEFLGAVLNDPSDKDIGQESDITEFWITVNTKDTDTVIREMKLRYGRPDVVIFHDDGTITVVEIKNGDGGGIGNVVKGIGQLVLYATQLGESRSAKKVNKRLVWSTTNDSDVDSAIRQSCVNAGVIPDVTASSNSLATVNRLVAALKWKSREVANRYKDHPEIKEGYLDVANMISRIHVHEEESTDA